MRFFARVSTNLVGFLLSGLLIVASFYFQFIKDLEPCTLCIVQRILVILIMLLFFWGVWLRSVKWLRLQQITTMIAVLGGVVVAARHIYIQHFPPMDNFNCSPGLDYMLKNWPLSKIGRTLFEAHGSCSEIVWQWWGLTMPAWTLIFFLILASLLLYGIFKEKI